MKKMLMTLAAAILLLSALSGCGKKNETVKPTASPRVSAAPIVTIAPETTKKPAETAKPKETPKSAQTPAQGANGSGAKATAENGAGE